MSKSFLLIPLLLAAACGKESPAPDAGATPGAAAAPSAESTAAAAPAGAATAPDADEAAILKVVPTVEEAAAKAAREIDADNAEATLAEIRKEVGGGR